MGALVELDHTQRWYTLGGEVVRALDEVTLNIDTGEYVAIIGASGSGKSTLMNIIGCLDRPTGGAYRLEGRDTANLSRAELAVARNKMLGFVFQNFNLLARTSAVENVELPLIYAGVSARERRRRALESLERVGLQNRADHEPTQLSGGQQQRVAIARALVTEPRIVLADEPTGALDSRTSVEVMDLFESLSRGGLTLIVVTHAPDIAARARRVLEMRDGRVLSDTRREGKPT